MVSAPVTVTSVRFVGGEPGIKLIGYQLVPPDRPFATIQSMPGFPPVDRDLPTARVPNDSQLEVDPLGQGYQLLLGIEVTAEGRWVRKEVVIQYRSAGVIYEQSIPAFLAMCTPDAVDASGECELP